MEKERADPELYFNPKISKKNLEITKKYPDDFLKRVEYYKLFKKRNIENLRNKYFLRSLTKLNDMRFEPKVNNYPYNNIQSKVFNFKINQKINNENKGNKEKNVEDNKQQDETESQQKLTANQNNINKYNYTFKGPRNIVLNAEENRKNLSVLDYQTEEIWPKEVIHKYLEPPQVENSKDDNL